MQVYQGLDIITNKHPPLERKGIKHHVMDHVSWTENYFIHRFAREANAAIEDIHSRGKIPIIIGGTHYYLQNLLFNNKTIESQEKTRSLKPLTSEERQLLEGPVEDIFSRLKEIDPIIAEKFHPQDKRKLKRALEVYLSMGRKPSEIYHDQKLQELEDSSLKYNTLLFWIYCEPETLKPRLDDRVEQMMSNGAIDEIKNLYSVYKAQNPPPDCTSGIWQVIGFKEFLPWLLNPETRLCEEGKERMKIRTRQYAKYQVKWIKKLLAVELQKEARFNYMYGGKLYMLDATNLSKWDDQVKQVGFSISNQFLEGGPQNVAFPQVPEWLQPYFPSDDFLTNFNSNKRLNSVQNWRHFECPVCRDRNGTPMVAVGQESWQIHLNSRRHRRQIAANTQNLMRKRDDDKGCTRTV